MDRQKMGQIDRKGKQIINIEYKQRIAKKMNLQYFWQSWLLTDNLSIVLSREQNFLTK